MRGSRAVAESASALFTPDATVERLVAVLGNNSLARILGVSAGQPTRWRTGGETISPANRRRLSDLDHVLDRLLMELWPDQAGDWLTSPNAHLAGVIPIDVLVLRGAPPVVEAIDALAAGASSPGRAGGPTTTHAGAASTYGTSVGSRSPACRSPTTSTSLTSPKPPTCSSAFAAEPCWSSRAAGHGDRVAQDGRDG